MRVDQITTVLLRAAAAATAMAALAACGSGDGRQAALSAAANTPSVSAPPVTPESKADNQTLLNAGDTAQGAVVDSTVISIESEHNGTGWEVQVVTADGTEQQLEVSIDGATITSGPTVKSESADDKAKHRSRVEAAKIDYREAVTKVTQAVAGRITELNLDSKNGITVWEADIHDFTHTKHEVSIDAGSGEVVSEH